MTLRIPCRKCGQPVDLAGPFHRCPPKRVDVTDIAHALGVNPAELDQMVDRVKARTTR